AGKSDNFMQLVNNSVVHPLNKKLGNNSFKVLELSGETLVIGYNGVAARELKKRFDANVPAGLAQASPERIATIVHDAGLMKKVAQVNPEGVKTLARKGNPAARDALASF
ncbi:hypothetical protein CO111_03495, partial [Candidatus Desantisbacteria bacterium CG_4_9_14_3_um_filter_50_7]